MHGPQEGKGERGGYGHIARTCLTRLPALTFTILYRKMADGRMEREQRPTHFAAKGVHLAQGRWVSAVV